MANVSTLPERTAQGLRSAQPSILVVVLLRLSNTRADERRAGQRCRRAENRAAPINACAGKMMVVQVVHVRLRLSYGISR